MATVYCRYGATSLTASTTLTMLQVLAPSTINLKILEVSASFNGTDPSAAPFEVQLMRQTTLPTATATTATDLATGEMSGHSPTLTVYTGFDDTEPTYSDIIMSWLIHPQAGVIWTNPEPGRLVIPAGERVGLVAITPSVALSSVGYITVEE